QPMTIMTSYNLLNGTHTANSFELITNAARDEWGFAGAVMTDWGTTSEMGFEFLRKAGIEVRPKGVPEGKSVPHCSQPELCIKAGNDWIMPGNMNDINRIIDSVGMTITKADLQDCVRHILTTIMKSSRYENSKPYASDFALKPFITVE
ncbi:MAG: hypothetical protein K5858_05255, partial [Lachnospiraceae bacterium]|nr:hypothetical protein [Lachnospiraceae bacterium]